MFYSAFCFAEVFEKLLDVEPGFLGCLSQKQTEKSAFYTPRLDTSPAGSFSSRFRTAATADGSPLVQHPLQLQLQRLPRCPAPAAAAKCGPGELAAGHRCCLSPLQSTDSFARRAIDTH